MDFAAFKMGKRLKLGAKEGEERVVEDDQLFSEMEKWVTQGRYILEKKTKIQSVQGGIRVVSCEFSSANTNKIMVLG